MDAESEINKGSIFTLHLLYARPTILVVDDERDARTVLRMCLKFLGVNFIEAENGKEALDMIEASAPHLIITDINIPEMYPSWRG